MCQELGRVSTVCVVLLCTLHRLTTGTELNGSLNHQEDWTGDAEKVAVKTWQRAENDQEDEDPPYIRAPYPDDIFSVRERRRGWVVLHVTGMLYMFVALAFVSHQFFIPALGVITENLSLSDDVAGATVLAAGRSIPKLLTCLLAVFFTEMNVGFGTIVGSAVFNILFIVGVCALFSRNLPRLTCWPVSRDLSFYSLDLILLILFFLDNVIMWWESLILVLSYVSYLVCMKFNSQMERTFRCRTTQGAGLEPAQDESPVQLLQNTQTDKEKNVCTDEKNEEKTEEPLSLKWPDTPGKQVAYIFLLPVIFPLWLTVPDVRNQKSRKFFPVTFLGSIVWIAVFSYLMVWWANLVAETLRLTPEIMGLTVLAVGTSVPDVVTSVTVARRGCGDMVVSGSVGNNIFNIAVGLPLPWLFYSVFHGVPSATVSTAGLLCSVVLLFLVLALFIVTVMCCGWRLCKVLGAILLLLYFMFVGLSLVLSTRVVVCPL